jgi:hypothetical protein
MCYHSALAHNGGIVGGLVGEETTQCVEGSAGFEGAAALQVFAFEEEVDAGLGGMWC